MTTVQFTDLSVGDTFIFVETGERMKKVSEQEVEIITPCPLIGDKAGTICKLIYVDTLAECVVE